MVKRYSEVHSSIITTSIIDVHIAPIVLLQEDKHHNNRNIIVNYSSEDIKLETAKESLLGVKSATSINCRFGNPESYVRIQFVWSLLPTLSRYHVCITDNPMLHAALSPCAYHSLAVLRHVRRNCPIVRPASPLIISMQHLCTEYIHTHIHTQYTLTLRSN